MLFADSICASRAFTDSFRREMAPCSPTRRCSRFRPTDPIWTPKYGGFDLATVTRRDPQPAAANGPLKAVAPPCRRTWRGSAGQPLRGVFRTTI